MTSSESRARVLGLGGVFIKAPDIEAWKAWYRAVLGIEFADFGAVNFAHPSRGSTNIAAFASDSGYFAPSQAPFMINLIVEDLEAILALADRAGVRPLARQDEEYGRFAWLIDPAGVKVELWEPLEEDPI